MACGVGWKSLGDFTTKPSRWLVSWFGLKTEGRLGTVKVLAEGTWHLLRAYFETKGNLEEVVLVRCFLNHLNKNAPAWDCILILTLGVV